MSAAPRTDQVRDPLPPRRVLGYGLTVEDALAWVRQDPSRRKRDRAALATSGLGGMALLSVTAGHMPEWLSRLHSTALAIFIVLLPMALMALARRLSMRREAAATIPAPVQATLQIWDRRLAQKRSDLTDTLVITPASLRGVILTRRHVFLMSAKGTIVVAATAFAAPQDMAEFAAHWDDIAE